MKIGKSQAYTSNLKNHTNEGYVGNDLPSNNSSFLQICIEVHLQKLV